MTTPGGTCRVPDCDRIVADAWVCSTCTHRLTVALTDAPDLLAELDVDLTRQSRTGQRVGGRSVERPLPYDPAASLVRDALTSTLRTWCLVLAGDLLGQAPADSRLVAHLAAQLERVRHHVEGGAAVDEITAAVTAARDHLHRGDTPGSVLAGLCPDCGNPVYAREGAATARCHEPECDGLVDVAAWRQRARSDIDEVLMSAADAARALTTLGEPVTAARIRQWGSRRGRKRAAPKLTPRWVDPLGRPQYRVGDIRALLNPTTTTAKDAS
ncbi:hypothetical protein [Nocardiopsis synnemataformans]|uniref:hypothetical protein n=1 Tax=Nocardiopsis synnemataformans TaxID=61305 RepID=UPI003EB999DD